MYYPIQTANNKGADQTVWMRRLIVPLLFAHGIKRFSHDVAQEMFSQVIINMYTLYKISDGLL